MDESLWSSRNVAEYVYCPRLFYYLQVEGIFVPSSDTEKGMVVHQRVDKPSALQLGTEPAEVASGGQRVLRSLVLTNETLGITATLDLVEVSGRVAVPVEYRKGHPKGSSLGESSNNLRAGESPLPEVHELWPSDRIQLGLQVILLEAAGYSVSEAAIYYAAEKLRLSVPVNDAFKAEALRALENAKLCAQGPRPLPLINDPRCPKCSLQPICLPDEVNQLRNQSTNDEHRPRMIWPPRDDGIYVVAQQDGVKVGVRGMELRITDKDGVLVKSVPLANLESLSLLGSVQISTQAIGALADMSTPIAFLSSAGRLIAMVDPLDSVSAEVRRAQVRKFDCMENCLELARALVSAKIMNQRILLLRNHVDLPPDVAPDLLKEAKSAAMASSIDAVRGHEGQAAAIYFRHFSGMFKIPLAAEFEANGRKRRPPPDPINACLSLGYSMLTHECVAALRLARLEPSIGGFHVSRPGRPALALDLMEPFRPLIADSIALTCFNKGELSDGHFLRTSAGCSLTEFGRRNFFNALGRRMETEVTHPVFNYHLSYRRMIVLHARMIAAWLAGEIPTLAFLTTR